MNAAVPENGNVRFTISQLHLPCEDEVRGWECCQCVSVANTNCQFQWRMVRVWGELEL